MGRDGGKADQSVANVSSQCQTGCFVSYDFGYDDMLYSYGLYCEQKNNPKKHCSDYKVRYCCKIESPSQWGTWSAWSKCTKTCGGGKRTRDRVCNKKKGAKQGCYMDGPDGDPRFKEQTDTCNPLPCPSMTVRKWRMARYVIPINCLQRISSGRNGEPGHHAVFLVVQVPGDDTGLASLQGTATKIVPMLETPCTARKAIV